MDRDYVEIKRQAGKGSLSSSLSTSLLLILPLSFLALFYFYPLFSVLQLSLGNGEGLAVFGSVLADEYTRSVVWFTVWQATLSTLLTLALGLPGAYLLARYRFRGKQRGKML